MVVVTTNSDGKQILARTKEDEESSFSFLRIIDRVDNLPYDYSEIDEFKDNMYYLMTDDNIKIGFVCKFILESMTKYAPEILREAFVIDESKHYIRFISTDFETRNELVDRIGNKLRQESGIEDLKGWRDERYTIWSDGKPYLLVERAMAGPLGIITYGVHVNGYMIDYKTHAIKFWIPRRSASKPTWPLMLDNIIAGGIGHPYGIHETLIKEANEEANLEKELVESRTKSAGVVSYLFYQGNSLTDKFNNQNSYIVGEVEHVYDMELTNDIVPRPNDGEVDSFNLLSLEEVINALQEDQFKPNCALIMVDFLIRHGYITAKNEPKYLQISNKIHRTLPFPTRN